MRLLKIIFGFFWALWGVVCFLLVIIIPTPLYALAIFFGGRKYVRNCIWINMHFLSPLLLRLYGIKVKVIGKELISIDKWYVFIATHLTLIDVMASCEATPQPVYFLAKNEAKYLPFFGYTVRMLNILVNRTNKESRKESLQYMLQKLKERNRILFTQKELEIELTEL